jgi:hypothetical protein
MVCSSCNPAGRAANYEIPPVDIHACDLNDPDPSVPSVADEKWRDARIETSRFFGALEIETK